MEFQDQALFNLAPSANFRIQGGVVEWLDSKITQPSEAEVDAEITRLQAAHDTKLYARNRKPEYPSMGDQLDMIYKDNLNSTTTHKDAVEAVKTKWPKDNSGPVE